MTYFYACVIGADNSYTRDTLLLYPYPLYSFPLKKGQLYHCPLVPLLFRSSWSPSIYRSFIRRFTSVLVSIPPPIFHFISSPYFSSYLFSSFLYFSLILFFCISLLAPSPFSPLFHSEFSDFRFREIPYTFDSYRVYDFSVIRILPGLSFRRNAKEVTIDRRFLGKSWPATFLLRFEFPRIL